MTLIAYLAGSDKAHKVNVGDMGLTTRADGSPGFGNIIFDDPDKELNVRGWMKVVVQEDECLAAPILFSGYVGPRRYSRSGPTGTYKSGGSRWIDCTLVDENAVLGIRLIDGADGKRPAETHNERIDWLLASNYLDGLIESDSLVDTSHPRPFEEADYRDQFPDNVLEDIAGPIFKTFFVYVDGATGDRILFFDAPVATVGDSTLGISNILSEVDEDTVFFPFLDGDLVMDPSEVIAKDRYTYAKGVVVETRSDTLATFFTDNGLGYRGRADNNSRIGSEASARIMAQGILERNSEEDETVTVRLILPKTHVGLIRAGQRIECTFTHLDGWETGKFSRVTECTVTQWNGRQDLYLMQLELNTHGLASGGGAGGGAGNPPPADDFPYVPPVPQVFCATTPGTGLSARSSAYSGSGPDWAIGQEAYRGEITGAVSIEIASFEIAGYIATTNYCTLYLYYGWDDEPLAYVPVQAEFNGAPGTFTSQVCWNAGALSQCQGDSSGTPYPTTPSTILAAAGPGPHVLRIYGIRALQEDNIGPATFCVTIGDVTDVGTSLVVPNEVQNEQGPPSPAQEVGPEIVLMSGVNGTTANPFADGSLRVFYDQLEQTAAIVSYDGAAGTFVMAGAPLVGWQVTVRYQGR